VAQFQWRQQERQSEHEQDRIKFRVCIDGFLLLFGALLEVAAELDNATAGVTPAYMLSLRSGRRGGHREGEGGS
jgi:hypothetical protein